MGVRRSHADPSLAVNFAVPVFAWGAGVTPGADLLGYGAIPGSRINVGQTLDLAARPMAASSRFTERGAR